MWSSASIFGRAFVAAGPMFARPARGRRGGRSRSDRLVSRAGSRLRRGARGLAAGLLERLEEDLARLRTGDAVAPVEHEERDPVDAERAGLVDVGADFRRERVAGEHLTGVALRDADLGA